ncbi:MAG TPA: ABC transporter ATP-binding protein, partial [Acinetobacter lwoffii]|nr:ABC transporter ATP-binding protein [Acinetobacter lwoffii]
MIQSSNDSTIMPQAIISAQKLTQKIQLSQKQLTIFENLDLEIQAGEQVAITGRSGSGKSTLLGILATLDQASSGQLMVCGESVSNLNEEQRALVRLRNIGFVFQSFQLLPHLTALENVMLPLRLQPGFKYAETEHKALALLHKVGLDRQAQQTPKVLSGGEQQRVAIARALVSEPKIIFADEPTGNLDGETAREIEQLLFQLNQELGTTLVLVTHDRKLAQQ